MSHNIIIYNVICMYPLHDDGPESLSLLHMGRRRTDNRINKCSPIETNLFDVGPRIIVPLYLYLYEVLGPGREDMSGQWSVWCSHLQNYAVGL